MRITCPSCASGYDVPDDAIGPAGRKVRCRACGESWIQAGPGLPLPLRRAAPTQPPPAPVVIPAPATAPVEEAVAPAVPIEETAPVARRGSVKGPLIALGLVLLVLLLGGAIALIAFGPNQVATGLGLSDRRVPLGIAITKQPDWRMIAGGSELFAVSGRIWNPTATDQAVPDIRAELKDTAGRTVYAWTITRPQPRLAPGKSIDFDAAAVDVPRSSSKIAVSFLGTGGS
ncbi:zinc-ribbon domain-containing protein [Sphingomonas sp. BIUV-7]|uniref:Zinc-ribbon domain-containing protein n=1 Tax=Sphingomonas natans TaxID=3063330 RepID=A0ABT8YDB7_9SPHN|nr:zinc-ribbon domain-containing protein [Sphingomonas sp. BIUV-7]MDO6416314.1 zinc-ribbon domain-containing protein [Sphingomonas sp. BIUV-7]